MDIIMVFSTVFMMGIIIFFGYLLSIKLSITVEVKHFVMTVIINLAMPAIILNGVFQTDITNALLHQIVTVFIISIVFNVVGILLALAVARIFKFQSLKAKKIAILSGLGNTGFIGIPLCATIFGPVGGLLAAIFDAGLDIVIFTLVLYLLQNEKKFELRQLKALLNAPVFAIIIGMTIAVIGYQPPVMVKQLAATLSSIAAPLAMLYIGMLLAPLLKQKMKLPISFLSIPLLLKLLLLPVLFMVVILYIPIDEQVQEIVVLQVAMPTFMLASVLFSKYLGDEHTAVLTTIYSTLLSLATIPLISFLYLLLF
ncbi:AEC family transporter [Bacillus alkalicellulosilyticus]|uniref:AEC family transporter n=1 Tax=Alkalihalobacterium alkalicellulosilyticum TaxID=1912214 RepID=UPI000995FA50|nr:AEC family transporter [Bacillus alkalicellulosilyticus]